MNVSAAVYKGAFSDDRGTNSQLAGDWRDETVSFLSLYGYAQKYIDAARAQARRRGTYAVSELRAVGAITDDAYYRTLALHTGVRFVSKAEVNRIISGFSLRANVQQAFVQLCDGSIVLLIAPAAARISSVIRQIAKIENLSRIAICTPATLRELSDTSFAQDRIQATCTDLRNRRPRASSYHGPAFSHGMTLAALFGVTVFALFSAPTMSSVLAHLLLSLFFFACVALRVAAILTFRDRGLAPIQPCAVSRLPKYSVIVALRDEANLASSLVTNLKELRWPTSKLQVLLVCEADDASTISALEKQPLPAHFEIIRVPVAEPRTKPKALSYALHYVDGDYLTVYDAEDEPHPHQLIEAYQRFEELDGSVACLQAPLLTTNETESNVAALFHLEYSGLFRGLLPWIERAGAPLLLGGTSNHFRTDAIRHVGGWDPYNVTEDADIGLRLWRFGYRSGMITRPTLEPGPSHLAVWVRQRTRWFKGWLQTVFVHTKDIGAFVKAGGFVATAITLMLLIGTVFSALLHPVMLVAAVWALVGLLMSTSASLASMIIAWVDWSTILVSYIAFAALCWRGTFPDQRKRIGWRIFLIPVYWLGFSYAAWRAVRQLTTDPFLWEKTPH
ncbi:MAG: glycosyltransferase family 2 protein [Pseudomonadota bacterium]